MTTLPHPHPLAAALLLAFASLPLQAQNGAAAEADASFDIGRVTIHAGSRGPLGTRRLLTSVDVLNEERLAERNAFSNFELFDQLPGVMLTGFNQGTTNGKVSFRGFNGEGEVNAVKLLIDGIPANSNNGNMPYLDMVFPLELQAVEVVRGTNDARYGLHNIAGTVNLVPRRGGNETLARAAVGSFDSVDLQLAKGIETERWTQNYFIGHKRTDGWREHSEADKTALSGQWFYKGGRWTAGLVLRAYESTAQEPGYLTEAQVRADRKQTNAYNATDGGDRRMSQAAIHGDAQAGERLDVSFRLYRNRFEDQRWVRFSAAGAQQERQADETHTGARATAVWRPTVPGLQAFALEGGVDTERQDNLNQRFRTVDRVRQAQTRDLDYALNVHGAFVQAVLQPTAAFKLVPALRFDRLSGELRNPLAAVAADRIGEINDYGTIRQPKISAVWTPSEATTLYANWGRTWQVGTEAATFKTGARVRDLAPSINDGAELGLKFKPGFDLDGRLAVWQQKASNEVLRRLGDPSGDSDNIGGTRRRGLDLQLAWRPAGPLQAWMAAAFQRARITEGAGPADPTRGKELDHVPRQIVSAGLDWLPGEGWALKAWAQHQGDYELTRNNDAGRFGGFTLLNLGLSKALDANLKLEAQVLNLMNREYAYAYFDTTANAPLLSPGAPRSVWLAISARY